METPSRRRGPLMVAVLLSLAVLGAAAWLRGGVAATSHDAVDSAGRTMGFNDVFSAEHYGILLRNADWRHAVGQMGAYDLLLGAAHLVLLALLATAPARAIRWFLWPQAALFFWGWFGFWWMPIAVFDLLFLHHSDREGFVDIPYVSIMGQGAWFWCCGFLLWKLRRGKDGAEERIPTAPPAGASDVKGNLFDSLPANAAEEEIRVLCEQAGLRLERIASCGHASPPGFWYDQASDEWVLVVRGTAALRWDDNRVEELGQGDWRMIPAHRRHRVERTDPDTLWLALHLPPAAADKSEAKPQTLRPEAD